MTNYSERISIEANSALARATEANANQAKCHSGQYTCANNVNSNCNNCLCVTFNENYNHNPNKNCNLHYFYNQDNLYPNIIIIVFFDYYFNYFQIIYKKNIIIIKFTLLVTII